MVDGLSCVGYLDAVVRLATYSPYGCGCGREFRRRRGRETSGPGYGRGRVRTQRNGGTYCHAHGNCNYFGTDCNTPIENHNPIATFTNMLVGSTFWCYWIPDA